MREELHAGDLLVPTPRRGWSSVIPARRHDSADWSARIPQDSLVLVAALAAGSDWAIKVIYDGQLFYVLSSDVEPAKVSQ